MSNAGKKIITAYVVHWAATECHRQRSGELSVAHMIDAWLYLHRLRSVRLSVNHIQQLGALVEPVKNRSGFRRTPVMISGRHVTPWQNIPHAMKQLVSAQSSLSADSFYREFEIIHPFIDGNGRVGSLLYNWHRATIDSPDVPLISE